VWGRRAKKSTLEDDTPDVRELAFAEGGAAVPMPTSMTTMPQSSLEALPPPVASLPAARHESVDSTVSPLQAPITAPTTIPNSNNNKPKSEMTEEELFQAVLEESKKTALQDSSRQLELENGVRASNPRNKLTERDMEECKENSRCLLSIITSDDVDVGYLQTVLDMCREDQRRVAAGIEDAMLLDDETSADNNNANANNNNLAALIDLNVNILDAIESGERVVQDNRKPAPRQSTTSSSNVSSTNNNKKQKDNLDVQELVVKQDIFSLICMLRVHQNEKRLDAAMALMRFARAAEQNDPSAVALRDEIRSSGGMHSLLTLFWTRGIRYELRVVTALAVAFVLPSFVEPSSLSSPSLGLKIVECLRFLSTAQSVAHNGEFLSADELFAAAGMALTTFWVIHLEPLLRSRKSVDHDDANSTVGLSLKRQHSRGSAGSAVFDQRQETIAGDELLEMTVSLIIDVAKHESDDTGTTTSTTTANQDGKGPYKWSHHLVEQVCALEIARPIAVRKGILKILVKWIRSNDRERIRAAALALRYLTSVNDKYMAGWIHSEMVNKGAVEGLAELTHDISATHDVRLAIAQILSSLCAAPHTRAAVVEANCFNFFIGVLYEHHDPSTEELALFAGSAVLQLAAGAIARASAFNNDDREVFGLSTPDRRDSMIG